MAEGLQTITVSSNEGDTWELDGNSASHCGYFAEFWDQCAAAPQVRDVLDVPASSQAVAALCEFCQHVAEQAGAAGDQAEIKFGEWDLAFLRRWEGDREPLERAAEEPVAPSINNHGGKISAGRLFALPVC